MSNISSYYKHRGKHKITILKSLNFCIWELAGMKISFFPFSPWKDQILPFFFQGPIYTDLSFFASNHGRDKKMFSNASQMPKLCTMKFTLKLFKIFENVTTGFNLYCVMLYILKLSSAGVHKTRSLVANPWKLNLSLVNKTISQIMQNNLSLKVLGYLADFG